MTLFSRRQAFTMLELLVATAILALMSVLLFSMVNHATKLWRQQTAEEDGFREARGALAMYTRDLNNSVAGESTNWFFQDTNMGRVAFVTSLPFSAQRTNQDRADLCIVGYSLEWGKVNPADNNAKEGLSLYRYLSFSEPTFTQALLAGQSVSNVFQSNSGVVREVLARNVNRVAYSFYSTNDMGELAEFVPSEQSLRPDVVEVALSLLNDAAAARLASQADWTNTNLAAVRENERTFIMRFRLKNPPTALPTP